MPVLALIVIVVWLVVLAGVRTYIAYRQTGSVPSFVSVRRGTAAWWAKVFSTLGLAMAVAAPIADLFGLPPIGILDRPAIGYLGLALAVTGIVATFAAQLSMGASWRGDVDPDARKPLVTDGPFGVVRNPIFLCNAATQVGLALMVPNVLAVLMVVAVYISVQIQVRLVEEPYLLRVHGRAYREYASRTGRFLPLIGRLDR
jgi:protein-S-isoprenylcysteine O-methyltransferase Ste14